MSTIDREMMSRALQLAAKGRYTSSPNPSVGCVIARDDAIIGEGYTRPAGGNHGEIEALQEAGNASGATVYVTLEPCSHQGKTGPCADALIAAGVNRAVVACEDPNPAVAGSGIQKLKDAGIEVALGLLEDQARESNKGFIKRHEQGTPWVTVKMAASLDGRTAMASGQSQWITTPAARADVQRLRAEQCAIITGIGTQKMDDPSLTVRITREDVGVEDELRQPLRVVVDAKLQMSPEARMFQQPGDTLVATLDGAEQREKSAALAAAGAEVIFLPAMGEHIDLHALLADLAGRGCNQVLVEAGAGLAGAFIAEGLLDELVCYWAPKLFGNEARPMFNLPIETIDAHLALSIRDIRQIGEDIRVRLYPDKDY
ncbi:bifunctional diaminohydroxyphosphoribosylaminopyrimidine deaminase/5-amino-6-(5-phosphoribosylamino)uracil reductase RibD [Porticoccaceae bacterium]|jgi:diaminohydroxyphosphoribosylaminopyrimidine deaminase/5-amino-6-(5-phosphoribosylamino)uracil reductase|nr:bifunctional diaminohydroxyphosphoribosylaminopyrimidine deaminase/5-amino-6-(5-phosphoribosylamino)uracil reductase RibD [Porticoccaceae bacterium]